MKRLVLVTLLTLFSLMNYAQEPVKFDYCEIVGTGRFLSNKVTVEIDFGQETKFFSDNRYKDQNGKNVVFNSMVDAMNFMGKQGWEFVQAYVVSVNDNSAVYHYVLKKKSVVKTEPEETEKTE